MYEVTQTVRLHSLSVSLNRLPPINPNSNRESVARVNFTLAFGDGSFITHRGVHLIKVNNGGMYLSSPGKRRDSDNSYMEYASLTGPLMEAVRSEATAEYRRLRVAADAKTRAQATQPVAQIAPTAVTEGVPSRAQRIEWFNALWAEADHWSEEFASTGATIMVCREDGGQTSKAELLAELTRGTYPMEADIFLKMDDDSSTLLGTHRI